MPSAIADIMSRLKLKLPIAILKATVLRPEAVAFTGTRTSVERDLAVLQAVHADAASSRCDPASMPVSVAFDHEAADVAR